uniref:mRNA stability protein n=1 Tax=Globodera pallida TaxID=36090 RepID=A0A183CFU7_GLOPA
MRGEAKDPKNEATAEAVSVEKQQEILLMNKLASTGKLPPKSASNFLQKKLQQRKFFDSGDYNMNKNKPVPPPMGQPPTAGTTPKLAVPVESELEKKMEEVVPIIATHLLPMMRPLAGSISGGSVDGGDSDDEGGQLQIPRPDTVPQPAHSPRTH